MTLRHALFAADSKYKKQTKFAEDESDLDEDAAMEYEELRKPREIERAEKKFAKENEKLAEDARRCRARRCCPRGCTRSRTSSRSPRRSVGRARRRSCMTRPREARRGD